jgi:hypothetical protein
MDRDEQMTYVGLAMAAGGLIGFAVGYRNSVAYELRALRSVPMVDARDAAATAVYTRGGSLVGVNKRTGTGTNAWDKVTGIMLHQVAVDDVNPAAYPKMTAHLAVHHDGTVYWLHPLNVRLMHGHGLNNETVGIEVAGHFRDDDKMPEEQVLGVRRAIQFAVEEAARNGATITNLWAHRQTDQSRLCDPGLDIMQRAGAWAVRTLGLTLHPEHVRGSGTPLPDAWTQERPL